MKTNNFNKYYLFLLLVGLSIQFYSCHQRVVPEYEYDDFRRVIGPEGGVINFYEYNPEDSIPNVLLKMEFPENALDSLVVFNMYEFYDEQTNLDLSNLNMLEYSDFLYLIPFYESFGYNNDTTLQGGTDYHLSIDFNQPVTLTYKIREWEYDPNNKLFRIPIPKLNDPTWGENVWVHWNQQGYADGYYELDLIYLITGRWTEFSSWGMGTPSLSNWEELPIGSYTYNSSDSTVTFNINNTDYIYAMGLPIVK